MIQLLKCTVADQNADLHSINLYDCFGVAYPMSEVSTAASGTIDMSWLNNPS